MGARRSLTGSAVKAARKLTSRGRSTGTDTAEEKAPAKKAPAKKTPTKKPAAKKAPAKKAVTNKTGATKSPTAGKSTAKKAPAKPAKTAGKRTAAKKTAIKNTGTPKSAASSGGSRTTGNQGSARKTAKKSTSGTTPRKSGSTTAKSSSKRPPSKTSQKARTSPVTATASGAAKKAATKSASAEKSTKKPAKKAALSTLVVGEGEDQWTKAEMDEVLAELNGLADRLRAEVHNQEAELAGLMRDAGDGAGHDQADVGASSFERDHEMTVVNNSREMLAQTERALQRIHDGTYGVCESCGNPIGKLRSMAFPRATLCMSCKQREERR